jgi:hypothetical protein
MQPFNPQIGAQSPFPAPTSVRMCHASSPSSLTLRAGVTFQSFLPPNAKSQRDQLPHGVLGSRSVGKDCMGMNNH